MEQDKKKGKGRSTLSWVVEFAGIHRIHYIASILLAFGSVICGFVPYLYLGDMVKAPLQYRPERRYGADARPAFIASSILSVVLYDRADCRAGRADDQRAIKKTTAAPIGGRSLFGVIQENISNSPYRRTADSPSRSPRGGRLSARSWHHDPAYESAGRSG